MCLAVSGRRLSLLQMHDTNSSAGGFSNEVDIDNNTLAKLLQATIVQDSAILVVQVLEDTSLTEEVFSGDATTRKEMLFSNFYTLF